jgi:hypothetical protein
MSLYLTDDTSQIDQPIYPKPMRGYPLLLPMQRDRQRKSLLPLYRAIL